MTENMFPMRFTRAQLLECAEREISMRENVYPRWVEGQRMSQKKADAELAMMRKIRDVIANAPAEAFDD